MLRAITLLIAALLSGVAFAETASFEWTGLPPYRGGDTYSSHHNVIERNLVYRNGSSDQDHNIQVGSPWSIVRNNATWDFVGSSIVATGECAHCQVYQNLAAFGQANGDQGDAPGIIVGESGARWNDRDGDGTFSDGPSGPMRVYNNLVIDARKAGINYLTGCIGCQAQGNIAYHNGLAEGGTTGRCSLFGSDYDCNSDGTYYDQCSFSVNGTDWTGTSNTCVDPVFAGQAARNFHLTQFSPATDTAIAAFVSRIDLEGTVRPKGVGYDKGPYEFTPSVARVPVNTQPYNGGGAY